MYKVPLREWGWLDTPGGSQVKNGQHGRSNDMELGVI